MDITYIPIGNTYGDISIGDCFQLTDDAYRLYIKTPSMLLDGNEINALNLGDMHEYVFMGEDDIIIPVKTELRAFIN